MTAAGVDLSELRRHASVGLARRAGATDRPRGLAHLYAAHKRRPLHDLYVTDQAEARRGGRCRGFFSTCLAATVGAVAIAAAIFGSLEVGSGPDRTSIAAAALTTEPKAPARPLPLAAPRGLAWSAPKSERLQTTTDAISTRYMVQDSINEQRGNRRYLHNKPYARVMIRLATVVPDANVAIPPFNPLTLFANSASVASRGEAGSAAAGPEGGEVAIRVVELLGSILPAEDGQEMEADEVADLVGRTLGAMADSSLIRPSFAPEGLDLARRSLGGDAKAASTTVLYKTSVETDDLAEDIEGQKVRVRLARGETLSRLLARMGAEPLQAQDMVEAARGLLAEAAVTPGHEIELTLVPSLSGSGKTEPVRFTVFGTSGEHRVTVERNAAGEFAASATATARSNAAATTRDGERTTSLYASIYHGALAQSLQPETIQTILKVHAYGADFRRRARGSDALELFFDLKDEDKGIDGALGELLSTGLTVGGTSQRFYRFKEADGIVDYYDQNGNNSRRFLLRKPVRSDDVRLTSGFGIRLHPLLNQRKLHAGIDWAGPVGSPIIAAGNGSIEEAGYKGQYGNYVRISHANGYQTAYGHMRGLAPGVQPGIKVTQGQVIGYLGSTGFSSGPHLHFEVLVSNRFVDPLSIQVPREKRLVDRQLAAFQRERVRIDELARRPPVTIRSIEPAR